MIPKENIVKKAVFPVAGLGTRFLPATKASPKEMLNVVSKIDVGKVYLTHISHNLGLHDEVNNKLPKNIELAHDNLELSL